MMMKKSHGILIENLELTEEYFKSESTKKLEDYDNPLYPINHVHALAKRFKENILLIIEIIYKIIWTCFVL